ncbi:RNA-directed DNA polymerase [Vibrio parahaemolyticus]|uniref:RNA-directed DNA polymerase n=1 Tax=Vibrio parahaemolyticus TaxID=670 RepID=A0A7Y0X7I0_VIBPH|nr:reverse transcriptase family protein [Vibrio parahaemolyticus]EGR0768103.1 RNA-directed DNA polymerase [Vibrio parahaemolyticus]EGR0838888.1 RNA-directed DNA polymerase [Vibrio parahaemolyticus]EHC7288358.1 RNA-directed DNA polymerase [Vibrio parahaemolyticus]EJE4147577.1 RNA-directed DNA polymerase [Vibrio parahaemolyticus]EJL6384279.1 RNA-directed DNA polymerase [Vibrio parahaemolyticus]
MHNLSPVYKQKPISSIDALCRLLQVEQRDLLSLAEKSNSHYFKKTVEKSGSKPRVTYKASPKLRPILDSLKDRVFSCVSFPAYIAAGQLGKSYVANAESHIGAKMLMSEDIKDFFPSITQSQVENVYKHFFKFAPDVSLLLSELCTKDGKLVQGSPLSGYLANLVFFREEHSIVASCIEHGLHYTRYYDDIHISSCQPFYEEVHDLKQQLYGMMGRVGVSPHRSPKKCNIKLSNTRLDVHDVTINSHKTSPSRKRVSKVRNLLFNFNNCVSSGCNIETLVKQYRSILGHINTLQQQGYGKSKTLKKELREAVHHIDEKSAKKYARGYRKVKNSKEFKAFSLKASILKRINGRVASVINAEHDAAKKKLERNKASRKPTS